MIKLVIFDMDGVLIDSEPLWQKAEIEVFGKLAVNLTHEMCRQYQAIKIEELIEIWYNLKPWGEKNFDKVRIDMINSVEKFIIEEGEIMFGVNYILDFFNKKQIKKAIGSGSDFNIIETVINKLGIKNQFDFIHSGQLEKRGKPYPDIFNTIATHLDVVSSECLVFEDSINGVKAAKAANMKVVALPEKVNFNNPVYDVADFKLNSLNDFTEEMFQSFNYERTRSI